jgi:hypothetical protein
MRTINIASLACLVGAFWSTTSSAVVVGIDSFSVSGTNSSGQFVLFDNFSDGSAPPCGPTGCVKQPTFYSINSTIPLPAESGGFLQLDSLNGVSTTNSTGGARLNESVLIGGAKSQLLSTGGAISIAGTFTLPTLSGPLNNGYGIRFGDSLPGAGTGNQQVLELNVQWWTGDPGNSAGWYVRYLVQDFNSHTVQTVGANLVSIPQGADEISLSMNRVAGSSLFEAGYAYGSGGTFGSSTSLGSTAGFPYANYVRPQFHAFETLPVPEPETGGLMLGGLALVGLVARQRRKRDGAPSSGAGH